MDITATVWTLLPPIIAIALALITKEVYSSLLIGILAGALLYTGFNPLHAVETTFEIMGGKLGDNINICIFLVLLGILVSLVTKSGASRAYGEWAVKTIKSRRGASFATSFLGIFIFVDDYFNCLTVGSVMRPITDKHNISRVKLAYIIDATAAPVCIIAPISSWAAAVSGFAEDGQGLNLFIRAIPYNFYALLTLVMMIGLVVMKVDFGSMARYERNAIEKGDLFSGSNPYAMMDDEVDESKGSVMDLVFPIVVLVICCVIGMIYSGGFFSGADFVTAFSDSDASVGLMLGSAFGLVFAIIYYLIRRSMSFKEMMGCIPDGFKAMVPAIMILTPILLPIAKSFGLDPIYFGVVMVANLCIGLATPPVGNVLYCGVSLSKVKLSDLIKASLPFIGVMYLVLLLITMFPELIMFVPKVMG